MTHTGRNPTALDRRPPLDVPSSATYLGVSSKYVRRLVQERRIPFLKVGRLLRFLPDDLDVFLDGCRVNAA